MTILILIGMVFVIIWEMFHGRISLNSVLLLLLVNFVRGFSLELMYVPFILNSKSNLTLLHGFQLLVLLPQFIEIPFFCLHQQILNLKKCSDRLVIVAKGFLKLPNLHLLRNQKSPSLPRKLALLTLDKLLIVFSTKVNLLHLLYYTVQRCCLLQLMMQNCLPKNFSNNSNQISLDPFSRLELIWNCIMFL